MHIRNVCVYEHIQNIYIYIYIYTHKKRIHVYIYACTHTFNQHLCMRVYVCVYAYVCVCVSSKYNFIIVSEQFISVNTLNGTE